MGVERIRLMVGLGNPGYLYRYTRHNAGFLFMEKLGNLCAVDFRQLDRFKAQLACATFADTSCLLCLPQTFMNRSGEAVYEVSRFYKIEPTEILVIHDELDLILGRVKLKFGGGANGHRGVQSIIEQLGSKDFWRLRVGIGRPMVGNDISGHVLAQLDPWTRDNLMNAIKLATASVPRLVAGDFAGTMNLLHSSWEDK